MAVADSDTFYLNLVEVMKTSQLYITGKPLPKVGAQIW